MITFILIYTLYLLLLLINHIPYRDLGLQQSPYTNKSHVKWLINTHKINYNSSFLKQLVAPNASKFYVTETSYLNKYD